MEERGEKMTAQVVMVVRAAQMVPQEVEEFCFTLDLAKDKGPIAHYMRQ